MVLVLALHVWVEHLLLVDHVEALVSALVAHGHWLEVLVGVEAAEASGEGSEVGKVVDLDHRGLVVHWGEWSSWHLLHVVVVMATILPVVVTALSVVALHLLWHWWESDALWEVWQWVDEPSSLFLVVVEGAALTELALLAVLDELAWLRLVVGVDGTKSSLSKVLGKRLK